ncbi:MAG: damage repair protein [Acholeplasmataceae bacterium]|jgi:DNA polymerase V|nr:damage repair protein [Acholeplasmataceae bacterium]
MSERKILCIDLKSFYASVECALRGLDPFLTPLVVADKGRGGGSIVLAVSPYLRKLGFPSRCRIYELPEKTDLIFAKPRMNTYIEYAIKVLDIYLDFVSDEDLFVYSIDEVFLDVTNYLKYYQSTAEELAKKILKTIEEKLKISATCGIGPNMLIAKFALDLESKTTKTGIANWDYTDIPEKLWPIKELKKIWGIGTRMERNLNRLGIHSVYDLAHYDVKRLKKHFGVIGVELSNHAHGRDKSLIQDQQQLKSINQSYSVGQVLFKDYGKKSAMLIIKEMVDDLTRRLRLNKKMCQTIRLAVSYSKEYGGGFSRQARLLEKTNSTTKLIKAFLEIFNKFYENKPLRKISVSVTNLTTETTIQLNLFEDYQSQNIEKMLDSAIDEIKLDYGKDAIDRATVLLDESTKRQRNQTVGGHNA